MRAVIQRVLSAKVTINHQKQELIGAGLLVLLGVEDTDAIEDIEWLAGKICRLRIFNDLEGIMNLGLNDIKGDLMVVSQFTLFASTKKGNRPSYIRASKHDIAIPLYEKFLEVIRPQIFGSLKTGEFGADMQVELINDGPVTIIIDTKNKE